MGAVRVVAPRQDVAPQERPPWSRPLFSKTRTKGVSTGAQKATYGNVPTLTGRRRLRNPLLRTILPTNAHSNGNKVLSIPATQSLLALKTAHPVVPAIEAQD